MADKRIIELTNEKLLLSDGDMTIVDSESGTYKYDLNRLAKKTITDTTLSVEGKPADAKAVGDALSSVDVDTVNNARQLLSESYVLDQEPYLFRASGGDGADRVEECIVGGSVGWNQLCDSASVTVTSGHKYISKVSGTWTVGTSTGSAITGLTSGTDMVIDLTTLFGLTIADYIYSLEQSTAGAGVAWFRKLFPKDYYPYDAGTIKSVEGVSAHEMTGFNAYNPTTGKAKVVGNNVYQITGTYTALSLDGTTITPDASGYFTPDHDGELTVTGGNSTDTCVHLKWDGERDGEYEPYESHSYPLDSSLTLRGIPKLDSNNELYYDGDEYEADGTVTRKYGVVVVDGVNVRVHVNGATEAISNAWLASLSDKAYGRYNIFSDRFQTLGGPNPFTMIGRDNSVGIEFSLPPTVENTITALNAWFASNPTTVIYELATPTTETADPYTYLQTLDPYGTEEYVSTGIVPVGHESHYLENLRSKIEGLPKDFSTLIAPTEATYKATRNYTVGSLLIVDNILYKVTSAIANGGNITPNTNCTATTLAAVIAAL